MPDSKVYAFEPNEECFALLKKNVEENDCKNVNLIKKALSDKDGELSFYANEKDKASSSLLKETKELGTEVKVKGTTLDQEIFNMLNPTRDFNKATTESLK